MIVERGEHSGELDIKKGGLFPVLHGARTLALKFRVAATNTAERLRALCELGLLETRFTEDLVDAYEFMLGLRLKTCATGGNGEELQPSNFVRAGSLTKFETDLLKDSLQLVKEFKTLLAHHFDLGRF